MPFTIEKANQMRQLENSMKNNMYFNLRRASAKKTCWIHFSGLPIGVASAFLSIAARIGLIAEHIFKGALNILGSCSSPKCEFGRGVRQILAVSWDLVKLPFTFCFALIGIVGKTISVAVHPASAFKEMHARHNQAVKNELQTSIR